MSKTVKDQLSKIVIADMSNYDALTNTYHIPKYQVNKFRVSMCCLIELSDALLTMSSDNVLMTNWNNQSVPKSKYLVIEILNVASKMVLLNGTGYDIENDKTINYVWKGWLPSSELKIIKEY